MGLDGKPFVCFALRQHPIRGTQFSRSPTVDTSQCELGLHRLRVLLPQHQIPDLQQAIPGPCLGAVLMAFDPQDTEPGDFPPFPQTAH